jgi:hypothetical protein
MLFADLVRVVICDGMEKNGKNGNENGNNESRKWENRNDPD